MKKIILYALTTATLMFGFEAEGMSTLKPMLPPSHEIGESRKMYLTQSVIREKAISGVFSIESAITIEVIETIDVSDIALHIGAPNLIFRKDVIAKLLNLKISNTFENYASVFASSGKFSAEVSESLVNGGVFFASDEISCKVLGNFVNSGQFIGRSTILIDAFNIFITGLMKNEGSGCDMTLLASNDFFGIGGNFKAGRNLTIGGTHKVWTLPHLAFTPSK